VLFVLTVRPAGLFPNRVCAPARSVVIVVQCRLLRWKNTTGNLPCRFRYLSRSLTPRPVSLWGTTPNKQRRADTVPGPRQPVKIKQIVTFWFRPSCHTAFADSKFRCSLQRAPKSGRLGGPPCFSSCNSAYAESPGRHPRGSSASPAGCPIMPHVVSCGFHGTDPRALRSCAQRGFQWNNVRRRNARSSPKP
jgi:hypothetical protein